MLSSFPANSFMEGIDQELPPEPSVFPTLGNYRIVSLIGAGGMGHVYRAWQVRPPREVALKVLRPGLGTHQEAAALAALKHPGIVTVFEEGSENGLNFFSMELVDAMDIAVAISKVLKATSKGQGHPTECPLPPFRSRGSVRMIANIGVDIADALAAAHRVGVWHRDIKPSNILLTPDQKIKIVDFGIAGSSTQDTSDVRFRGAPPYMSPERLQSHMARIDQRADVYSVGVVLYELLTLQRPFSGRNNTEVIRRILSGATPTQIRRINPMVPSDLQTVVEKAMSPEANDRYASAADLRDDLLRFLAHESIVGRPQTWAHHTQKWFFRKRFPLVSATVLVFVALATWAWTRSAGRHQEREEIAQFARHELAAGLLESRPVDQLQTIAATVAGYNTSRLGREPRELSELRQLVDEYRLAQIAGTEADIDRWRHAPSAGQDPELEKLGLIERLANLRLVFPGDAEVRRVSAVQQLYPHLAVRVIDANGSEVPAKLYISRYGLVSLCPEDVKYIGATPRTNVLMTPGYYRVIVRFVDGGHREVPCYCGVSSGDTSITVRHCANESSISEGMIFLGARDLRMPDAYSLMPFGNRSVHVDSFFMDTAEVSNRQYREFVVTTGHAPPAFWPPDYDDARWGDLPVVGVTWFDAVEYATWAGKRLPTLPEWLVATGICEGRTWPWGSTGGVRGNVQRPVAAGLSTVGERWLSYVANAVPVRSFEEAATPEGIFHLFGNVTEWTESMAVNFVGSSGLQRSIVAEPSTRLCAGAPWDAIAAARPPLFLREFGASQSHMSYQIGFRCAKSAAVE
jgi:formylglycine-generating enzyme required for sulfatase activity